MKLLGFPFRLPLLPTNIGLVTIQYYEKKSKEQNQPLYMALIDLVKALDSVNREALWRILELDGCPPNLLI